MREIKFRAYWEKWDSMYMFDIYNVPMLPDEAVVMQYTGLKDKNNKEVYEGDVVNCSSGCSHIMIWKHDFFGMPQFYLSGLSDGYSWTEEEEVISNIYENPELLTNTN